MNENTLVELTLFDPENTFIGLLEKQKVSYRKVPATHQFVVATDETIEIVSSDNRKALIENLSLVFMAWLEEKNGRKLQALLVDGSTVTIERNAIKTAYSIIQNSLRITVFDQEYNNRISNS